jgi:hypothetical protein
VFAYVNQPSAVAVGVFGGACSGQSDTLARCHARLQGRMEMSQLSEAVKDLLNHRECPIYSPEVDNVNKALWAAMKVVYIVGPYRATTPLGILQNVHKAGDVALKYWRKGYAVICPHKNTALFDGQADDCIWLEGDKELLRRSDVVVMMQEWEQSAGATAEHDLAKSLGLEIIYE